MSSFQVHELPLHLMLAELTHGYAVSIVDDNHRSHPSRRQQQRVAPQPQPPQQAQPPQAERPNLFQSHSTRSLFRKPRSGRRLAHHRTNSCEDLRPALDRFSAQEEVRVSRWESCPILPSTTVSTTTKSDKAPSVPANARKASDPTPQRNVTSTSTTGSSDVLPPKRPSRSGSNSTTTPTGQLSLMGALSLGKQSTAISSPDYQPQHSGGMASTSSRRQRFQRSLSGLSGGVKRAVMSALVINAPNGVSNGGA